MHPFAARLKDGELERAVLHGGEDYELLFAAPESVGCRGRSRGWRLLALGG